MQFEVDMGELGVHLQSEAAYRQLRAAVQGKAREVLDLEQVRGGPISQLLYNLDTAVTAGAPKQTRDALGGELFRQCCAALCSAVRLTPEKRIEIAARVDAEAKMHGVSRRGRSVPWSLAPSSSLVVPGTLGRSQR